MNEKASVILTLYNGERFLSEQLESLLKQSYSNIEVIIVDDGSKDGSVDIANDFITTNSLAPNWKVVINRTNKGYAKNFIESCAFATGCVIFFCDQDDIWEQDKIKSMMQIMNDHNEIDLLSCDMNPFYMEEGGRKFEKKYLANMVNDGSIEVFGMSMGSIHLRRSGCTMCVRKKYYDKILPYWIEGWAHDDFVWKLSCLDGSCGLYHKVLINRRMHQNNATDIKLRTRERRIKQLRDMQEQYKSLCKYENDISADDEAVKIVALYGNSIKERIKLLERRNPFLWFKIAAKYNDFYPRKKGLFLDLYFVFFKTTKKKR